METGLQKIYPHRKDYHFLPSYGALDFNTKGLPESFSIYDGRPIPSQLAEDTRFNPPLPPLLFGCTGESGSFAAGLEDFKLYNPAYLYDHTPPGGRLTGRDVREMLKVLCNGGLVDENGNPGPNRLAYFNVYGAGPIDDFDAARIALWINQSEKRAVIVGTYWYWGVNPSPVLPLPSFRLSDASLHCYIITGWNEDGLEAIPWCGPYAGDMGKVRIPRALYNALMAQPWTGAYTVTKEPANAPIPVGAQAYIDHLIYMLRQLFNL